MNSKTLVMIIYHDEHLHLARDLHVEQLVVHLDLPGPTLNIGGHKFTYDEIDLVGVGEFCIMRNGIVDKRFIKTKEL